MKRNNGIGILVTALVIILAVVLVSWYLDRRGFDVASGRFIVCAELCDLY